MTGAVEDFDTVIAQVRAAIAAKKFNLVPKE
jgi:hypothetical protein